ncbi:MAG: DNA replication/repair protein RecF [Dehalococcoidia bacterium]|nr:DNA replication/repair protein RecF [Dehalococcoidia bacterium]
MHIAHLKLTNFRNYPHLDIGLPARKIVIEGDNAQGKTNFLEAIFFLATTRSHRASNERELIGWGGGDEFFPGAQLCARVQRADSEIQLEIILSAERSLTQAPDPGAHFQTGVDDYLSSDITTVKKKVRLNGLPRRAVDVVGQVKVVMFSAPDIDLVDGAPSLRRRYLDITLCQINNRYLRSLQRYQKIVLQRNHLLRRIGEGKAKIHELDFWDRELIEYGGYIVLQRYELLETLNPLAREIHCNLTSGCEELSITYLPSVSGEWPEATDRDMMLSQSFQRNLAAKRDREIAQGISLVGPHRDDLQFIANRVDLGVYGSRGQQRAVVQSLKLAEASLIVDKTGEAPILILDDVLSELDGHRQLQLLQAVEPYPQVFITTTGADLISKDFLTRSVRFRVKQGIVSPLEG